MILSWHARLSQDTFSTGHASLRMASLQYMHALKENWCSEKLARKARPWDLDSWNRCFFCFCYELATQCQRTARLWQSWKSGSKRSQGMISIVSGLDIKSQASFGIHSSMAGA